MRQEREARERNRESNCKRESHFIEEASTRETEGKTEP
jgi:hypothetical protein